MRTPMMARRDPRLLVRAAVVVLAIAIAGCSIDGPTLVCTGGATVTVSPLLSELRVGQTVRIQASGRIFEACREVAPSSWRWSSSSARVAIVDSLSGLVTALDTGRATITAAMVEDRHFKGVASVTVLP